MNIHDSEKMAGVLRSEGYGLTENPHEADLIIINTCSIRQKAEQKVMSELGTLKPLKKKKPSLRVAVAGCIAQQMGEGLLKKAPHVDYVIGPQNIHTIRDIAREKGALTAVEDNPLIADTELPALRGEEGRAWVSIMFGCDNFCTYCIVPYTRGRERSRPVESILREIRGLVGDGVKEVTLLGQNVNSYKGIDEEGGTATFSGLLRHINEIPGLKRIRFVTSHPRDLTEELIDSMAALEKLCEHIHLPMQSGSTRILGLMNRGYSYDEYKGKIERLREKVPGIAITSDIIAGFPSEGDPDHEATLKALGEIGFDGIFAFKYSPRPYTSASKMEGQIPEDIRLSRLHEILHLQDEITLKKNRLLEGQAVEVLVNGSKTHKSLSSGLFALSGRTRTNKIVFFEGGGDLQGKIVNIEVLQAYRHSLKGGVPIQSEEGLPVP